MSEMQDLKVIAEFIKEHFIMSLSTIDSNMPYSCTVFYVIGDNGVLYFTSSKRALHVKNIRTNKYVAGNIFKFNTIKGYEEEKIGVQFTGIAEPVKILPEAITALALYGKRFIGAKTWYKDALNFIKDGELYKVKIEKVKMYNSVLKIKHSDYIST